MRGSWLIVGCGYIGNRVLMRLHASNEDIAVVTRDAARAADFTRRYRARAFTGDFADTHALRAFCATLASPLRVLCLLPPSACVDAAGTLAPLQAFVSVLDERVPACAVLTSSTGVYGDQAGATVTAETPCRPTTAREQRLDAIERLWLGATHRRVVRYAGLHGPGRIIGLSGLRQRSPVAGDPDAWLNLIHADDAASLLLSAATGAAAPIELGADGTPVTRRVYYTALAALAGLPAPVFDGAAATRGGGARRCDPASTCGRLAWRPMYTDFRAALACSTELNPA